VQLPTKYYLAINMIPSLLARADEVIE